MEPQATYCPHDNKLRLYVSERLDEETYTRLKEAGFKWAPKQDCFVAPMWTPEREDVLLSLVDEIEPEGMTPEERAADRAARFEIYSAKRAEDANRAYAAVAALADNIPLGQPILVGHHSQRKAEKDAERIEAGMRKTVKLWETSEYWTHRAKAAVQHARYKERADVRHRRMKGLEADARKWQRKIDECITRIQMVSKPELTETQFINLYRVGVFHDYRGTYVSYDTEAGAYRLAGPLPDLVARMVAAAEKTIARYTRWVTHLNHRIAFEREMLNGWEPPKVARKKPDLSPLVNFRSEGCEEMTAAEWKKNSRYDVYQVVAFNADGTRAAWRTKGDYRRRVRSHFMRGQDTPVFITDMPVKYPPSVEDTAHAR